MWFERPVLRMAALGVVLGMLWLGSAQPGLGVAQTGSELEHPALRDFPAPFIWEGKAEVAIIADEADLPTAQRLVEALGQWTSDTIEIIGDRDDSPYSLLYRPDLNLIVVGGPTENKVTRYLNAQWELPLPFVPIGRADEEGLRYGISWRFKLWDKPGSGALQLFGHYILLVAGVDPQGTAEAAEALLERGPEMLGRGAFLKEDSIEVLVDPEVDWDAPLTFIDTPVEYAFYDGLLRVEFWPSPFPDGMALALIQNVYLRDEAWAGGFLGDFPHGHFMEDLPVQIQMGGLRRFLEGIGVKGFSLPELIVESLDLAMGVAQIRISNPEGGEDRFRLPPKASYRWLILRGETQVVSIVGEPYKVPLTVEMELKNLGLGQAVWDHESDRFFPQGFVTLALEVSIYSSHIKELEWGGG